MASYPSVPGIGGGNGGGATDPTFTTLTIGQVPKADGIGKLIYGDATVDPTTLEWTFDESINVPSGSINVGEVLQLTEGTADLVVVDLLKNQMSFSVNSDFTDATGSTLPRFFNFGAPENLILQGTDTTIITANPLNFSATGTVVAPNVRLFDQVVLRANGAMTNVRIRITDNATGLVVRYVPSKAIWDSGTGGLDLIAGDNTFFLASVAADTPGNFHLGYVPFLVENGQQIDFTVEADSVDLLGNVSNVPYLEAEIHDGPQEELAPRQLADRVQTTGLLEGSVISQASATTVDWTSGRGQVTNYADPENPVVTDVTWDAVAGLTPTDLATDGTTIFGYDSAGSLVEKLSTAISIEDGHSTIWFGSATHLSSVIVGVITSPGNLAYDGIGSFSDFINLVIGPANVDGNIYSANGANLNIDVLGGNAYILGSNFRTNPAISDIVTLPNGTALSFSKVYRSAGAGLSIEYDGVPTALIDPTQWDDGSGTLQTVSSNNWTIQRIFRSRNGNTLVAYGQETFLTRTAAIEALGSESFTEKSPLPLTLFRCSLVVSESATDLSDTGDAEFFIQSSFRTAGAQSATSTIPGITSPGGADTNIQYNDGGAFGGSARFRFEEPVAGETRVVIEASAANGKAVTTYVNEGGGTGLTVGHDDDIDESVITADLGPLTISTVEANDDILINPATGGNVGINKDAPTAPLVIYEDNANQDSTNGLIIEQDGDGGAIAQFLLTGVKRWAMGLDNTNGTALGTRFLIASGSAFADAERAISIDNDEMVAVGNFPAAESLTRDFTVYANNTGVTSSLIQQAGTGDAVQEWLVPGRRWSAGIDNSDSDKWMLSPSNGLADSILTVQTDGNVGINILSPTSGLHVYENDAATDDTTGIKIEQDGAGDAALHFLITGGDPWSMGIDQSDAERFKLAPNTDVGSASVIDFSTTDINFLSARTNLANTATTTTLTLNSPTATGLTSVIFNDELAALRGAVAYNNSLDQLQLNSAIGSLNIFTGVGLIQANTSSSTQNYMRLVSSGASATTGFQVENSGAAIDLELVYNQTTDRSHLTEGSANGLEILSSAGNAELKSTAGDILLEISANTGIVEIVGVNHEDDHALLRFESSDGSVDIHTGSESPVGSVSQTGGAFMFRGDELNTNFYLKKSAGAASTTGWSGVVTGTANTTANAIAVFDAANPNSISGIGDALIVQDATDTEIRINPVTAAGYAGLFFYDNVGTSILGDVRLDQSSGHLLVQNTASDIRNVLGGDFHISMTGGSGVCLIDSTTGPDTAPLITLDTGGSNGGVSNIFMTGRSPAANISNVGGAFAFRSSELNSAFYVKKSAGAASTAGWQPAITSSDLTVVDNALVTYDGTTGTVGQQSSGVTSITTATEAEIALTSQGPTGGSAIEFYDNVAAIKLSILHNDNLDENSIVSDVELALSVIGAALDIDAGDDITINANANANLVSVNDHFVFGPTTVDSIFTLKTPSATATTALRLANNSSTPAAQFEYDQNTDVVSIDLFNEVPLSITGTDHDENDILLTLASQGTNGAQTDRTVSNRTPIGNVIGNPGSKHTTVNGTSSDEYTQKGSAANNTDWNRNVTVNPDEGIEFVPTTVSSNIEGQVYYDSTDRSLSVSQGSGVTANLGKETFVPPRIRNDQGAEINNADAVYISGSDGTYPDVQLAQANTQATAGVIGLITQDAVAIGALGWCTTYGLVRDFDTQTPGWAAGDVLYLSATTAGGLTNVAPVFPNFVTRVGTVVAVGTTDGSIFVNHPSKEEATGSTPVTKSYAVGDYGTDNVNYSAGFYEYSIDESVLTIGGTVDQVFGDANRALNAHAFVVIGSTTTTGCTLTVHGTSITNAGTRATMDSEVIIADTDGVLANEYYETTKKWLGAVTFTLTGTSGALDFNYGVTKYEDFGNTQFTVTEFEAVGKAAGNDADADIILWHHSSTGWTYNAGAFKPEPTKICSMGDDYSTDDNIDSDSYFSYKRTGLNESIDGTALEGVIIEFDIATNNALWYANFHIGVLL